MRFFTPKEIKIPTGERGLEALELWEVRWTSRNGEWSSSRRDEIEIFTSEADAQAFSQALRDAFKLLRHTGTGTKVYDPHKRS